MLILPEYWAYTTATFCYESRGCYSQICDRDFETTKLRPCSSINLSMIDILTCMCTEDVYANHGALAARLSMNVLPKRSGEFETEGLQMRHNQYKGWLNRSDPEDTHYTTAQYLTMITIGAKNGGMIQKILSDKSLIQYLDVMYDIHPHIDDQIFEENWIVKNMFSPAGGVSSFHHNIHPVLMTLRILADSCRNCCDGRSYFPHPRSPRAPSRSRTC